MLYLQLSLPSEVGTVVILMLQMRTTDVKEQLCGKAGEVSLLETNFRIIVLSHCAKTICSYRLYSTLFHFAQCPEGLNIHTMSKPFFPSDFQLGIVNGRREENKTGTFSTLPPFLKGLGMAASLKRGGPFQITLFFQLFVSVPSFTLLR